jgi:hypothetical protein
MKGKKKMSELDLGKNIDEIEEPQLMPEGWRTLQLMDDPVTEENKAMKQQKSSGQTSEEAGFNWRLRLAVVDDAPECNGRTFFLRFPIPKEADKSTYTGKGQKVYDAKMSRIVAFVQAFDGYSQGTKVELHKGAKGMAYVIQSINQLTGQLENQIDLFNQGFKKVDGAGSNEVAF